MRSKTSITLAEDTLEAIDRVVEEGSGNRSQVIEQAVREFLARRAQEELDARELVLLNRAADRLNREVEEVLQDQVEP